MRGATDEAARKDVLDASRNTDGAQRFAGDVQDTAAIDRDKSRGTTGQDVLHAT